MTYIDGYLYGQHDALTWLTGAHPDDSTLAAFDSRVQMRAAMVCLGHNLAVGHALCTAFWDGVRHESARSVPMPWADGEWRPGCGRPMREPARLEQGEL